MKRTLTRMNPVAVNPTMMGAAAGGSMMWMRIKITATVGSSPGMRCNGSSSGAAIPGRRCMQNTRSKEQNALAAAHAC